MSQIRPLAICLFRHDDKILVSEEHDPAKGETFYRPLGGGIEFGEHTIHRELMEEIGAHARDLVYLGTIENIFTFNGIPDTRSCRSMTGSWWSPGCTSRP